MLDIPKARFVISDVHPTIKPDDDALLQVCQSKLTISTLGNAREVLTALHMPSFIAALFNPAGNPIAEWVDVRTKYKLTNVRLEMASETLFDRKTVVLSGCVLGKSRLVPKAGYSLDISTTIDNPISSKELAALFDLRLATDLHGSVKQIASSEAFPQS